MLHQLVNLIIHLVLEYVILPHELQSIDLFLKLVSHQLFVIDGLRPYEDLALVHQEHHQLLVAVHLRFG